jgi:ABC-2 type transport system permease protein
MSGREAGRGSVDLAEPPRPVRPDVPEGDAAARGSRWADVGPPGVFSLHMTAATARRVLAQLLGDHRTVGMVLIIPSFLLWLINQMFDDQTRFNDTALSLLGIFPFTTMFLITSVAMLRERTSGTLERLLTTSLGKLDLLLGYGIAFAVAAAAQASVACATAYLLLGLYTPGKPALVVGIAIVSAVLGMSLGLLASAFASSEFQAVQFMPALVTPQMLLGGLFVPRTEMADWLYNVSSALPMTYDIEALGEVGKTSLITAKMVRDVGIMVGVALLAIALAAVTLRRRTGPLTPTARRAIAAVVAGALVVSGTLVAGYLVQTSRYVWTENAVIDGDKLPIVAPATGRLTDWAGTQGTIVSRAEAIGRVEAVQGVRGQRVIRAPSDGAIAQNNVVDGAFVTAGTQLAVAYDLSQTYVTARVKETDIGGVHRGALVDISVDAYPDYKLTGTVWDVQGSTSGTFAPLSLPNHDTSSYQKITQVIPVKIAIADREGLTLVPGMNVTVHIHRK